MKELKEIYSKIKNDIEKRLNDFDEVFKSKKDLQLFHEMLFCLFTPQTKARSADKALKNLINKNLIFNSTKEEISKEINIVRFRNNKATYFVEAREKYFKNGNFLLKDLIYSNSNIFDLRNWLAENIKGYGYKEASHFLRNIGLYREISILDRHILKNLVKYNVIDNIPKSLSRRNYEFIEQKMTTWAKEINIPMSHLDFLLWYKEAGEIFK